jgi:type I restriction enzyme R subunit
MSRLVHLLKPSRDKFLSLENESERENFKTLLAKFHRLYLFVSQITRNFDIDMQKFHIFSHLLYKILPKRKGDSVEITDILTLEYYTLKQNFSGSIILKSDMVQKILPMTSGEDNSKISVKNTLEKIIQEINLKYGTNFTNVDKVLEKVLNDFKADKVAVKCAKENDSKMFRTAYKYDEHFEDILFTNFQHDREFEHFIINHLEILPILKEEMFDRVYETLQQ